MHEARYDVLFEPVRIGPVTAPNRFYQVPHCNGMGHAHPQGMAAMRGIKAEGGWGVVCTEECEISPSSEFSPYVEARLWDAHDGRALALMADAVHAHGSLAGIELAFNGYAAPNLYSREVPLAPSATPVRSHDPVQAREMSLADIRQLRRDHRAAAQRARDAGFDIVYVYAGHDLGLPFHFLSRRHNRRLDDYGGALENRIRLLRELITDAQDAVGDRCAVAVRLSVDDGSGEPEGFGRSRELEDAFGMLAELPDLWDLSLADWSNDSVTSRFADEGYQEPYVAGLKAMTTKPVVGTGRFTSPDAMVSQVRRGVLDLIGAARPSIADPFLPAKIREGRIDEIRECIGCNICVSGDHTGSPIRCTQNPTMAEEWRRGWHPERVARAAPTRVLVVGAGPAGLECAHILGKRGCEVALAEAGRELGGRLALERRLPGLSAWGRVVDYRVAAFSGLPNVEIYRESRLSALDVQDFGAEHVFLATGSRWRRDGTGRALKSPLLGLEHLTVISPDDVMNGVRPTSQVAIYDDDHYYMGSVLAELLRSYGCEVIFVTPAPDVAHWTHNTLEQGRIQAALIERGVRLETGQLLDHAEPGRVVTRCVYTGRLRALEAATLLLVTARDPEDSLARALAVEDGQPAGFRLHVIGDALAPGTIAAAVYGGHRAARHFEDPDMGSGFLRPRIELQSGTVVADASHGATLGVHSGRAPL